MRQFNLRNKGQVLLLALIMFSIVSILSAVLASMWQAGIEGRNQEKNSLRAFYLAQAGIERAKIWIKQNPSYSPFPYNSGWFSDLPGGRYGFNVTQGAPMTFSSVGEILDTFGNSSAKRQIEVKIQGYGLSPTMVPGSWDEK